MLATSANDEYIYLYLLPTFENFRTIKLSENKLSNYEEENELLIANNVFLSNCPIPCITSFINAKKVFSQ